MKSVEAADPQKQKAVAAFGWGGWGGRVENILELVVNILKLLNCML